MSGMPFADLKGKVAVVTGGSRGAGAAACRLLSLNGARVAAVAGDELALQEFQQEEAQTIEVGASTRVRPHRAPCMWSRIDR